MSEILQFSLFEIFDSHLYLTRNHEYENQIKSIYHPHTLTNVEVYNTEHKGVPYNFYRFKHKNAWEVHFSRSDEPSGIERLHSHKGSAASELIGTAIKLYKDKLERHQPIRYFGDDEKLNTLYDKAFKHISKNHFGGNLHAHKIADFTDVHGNKKSCVEVHHKNPDDSKIFKSESYISPYIKLCHK